MIKQKYEAITGVNYRPDTKRNDLHTDDAKIDIMSILRRCKKITACQKSWCKFNCFQLTAFNWLGNVSTWLSSIIIIYCILHSPIYRHFMVASIVDVNKCCSPFVLSLGKSLHSSSCLPAFTSCNFCFFNICLISLPWLPVLMLMYVQDAQQRFARNVKVPCVDTLAHTAIYAEIQVRSFFLVTSQNWQTFSMAWKSQFVYISSRSTIKHLNYSY